MTGRSAKRYAKTLAALGVKVEIEAGYSGRGMYGEVTVAVVTCDAADTRVALAHCPGLKYVRRDSMGVGAVFY